MKKYLLLAILLGPFSSHHSHAAQFSKSALLARDDTSLSENKEPVNKDILKKSPFKAFAIGFGPGFFVHGLAHYYAGNDKAGGWLLASEGASLFMFYYFVAAGIGTMDCEDCNRNGIYFLGFSSAALFFGGWIFDFADAPHQVKKHKAAAMKMQKISLGARKNAIVISYSFDP